MREFVIAGVDFLISKGEPYFLEVNASPGAHAMNLLEAAGYSPVGRLAKAVLRRVRSPKAAVLFSIRDRSDIPRLERLREFFPAELCDVSRQDYHSKKLVSESGLRFEPSVILFNRLRFSQLYRFDVPRINPEHIVRISLDKHLSTLIVRDGTDVETPRSFLSLSSRMAREIFCSVEFPGGVVVKGNFGQAGGGVVVGDRPPAPVKGVKLIQERIRVDPFRGSRFWDVRALVVDGKFSGATVRYADSPVVNIHRGGKMVVAPDNLMELVARPAEKVVRAIERVKLRRRVL